MGTWCPLHPISFLSHGGFSPGRERRHGEEEREAYRVGPMILGAKEPLGTCEHTLSAHTHRHRHKYTPCPAVGDGLDLPSIGARESK